MGGLGEGGEAAWVTACCGVAAGCLLKSRAADPCRTANPRSGDNAMSCIAGDPSAEDQWRGGAGQGPGGRGRAVGRASHRCARACGKDARRDGRRIPATTLLERDQNRVCRTPCVGLAKLQSVVEFLRGVLGCEGDDDSDTAEAGPGGDGGGDAEVELGGDGSAAAEAGAACPRPKLLVFAHHRLVMAGLAAALESSDGGGVEYVRIDGDTDAEDRHAAAARFRTDPTVRVALLSLMAAGVGLDFSAASIVVFAGMGCVRGCVVRTRPGGTGHAHPRGCSLAGLGEGCVPCSQTSLPSFPFPQPAYRAARRGGHPVAGGGAGTPPGSAVARQRLLPVRARAVGLAAVLAPGRGLAWGRCELRRLWGAPRDGHVLLPPTPTAGALRAPATSDAGSACTEA